MKDRDLLPSSAPAMINNGNNNSSTDEEDNDWFDDLNDNIPKLPTTGMPHTAY